MCLWFPIKVGLSRMTQIAISNVGDWRQLFWNPQQRTPTVKRVSLT